MSTSCEQIAALLDSYLDNELIDGAPGVASHLVGCEPCSREMETRRAIRGRLRSAVRSENASPQLQAAIRQSIRKNHAPAAYRAYLAVAAALIVCLSGAIAYQFGYLRFTRASQDSYVSAISAPIPRLMRVGLGDHVHCAVYKAFSNQHPTPEQMAHDLGQYQDLSPILQRKIEAGYRLETAHQCRYHGRRFVHLTLRNGATLVSLVISRKAEGESFEKDQLVPALTESGLPIYQAAAQRFEVTGFETKDYLVYVVSNLGQQDNLRMMAALAPSVAEFLQSVKS